MISPPSPMTISWRKEVRTWLVNILIGTFSLATLTWVFVGIQTFINDRRNEKRQAEREKRDAEYHAERMKEFTK